MYLTEVPGHTSVIFCYRYDRYQEPTRACKNWWPRKYYYLLCPVRLLERNVMGILTWKFVPNSRVWNKIYDIFRMSKLLSARSRSTENRENESFFEWWTTSGVRTCLHVFEIGWTTNLWRKNEWRTVYTLQDYFFRLLYRHDKW